MTSESRKPMRSGSSTGAPGVPSISRDQRNQYDPATTGYNPATGAGYKTSPASSSQTQEKETEQEQEHYRPITPTKGYDAPAGDDRINHAPSTADRVKMEQEFEKAQKSRSNRTSEHLGEGINGIAARIHVRCPLLLSLEATSAIKLNVVCRAEVIHVYRAGLRGLARLGLAGLYW